jgi:hypothetical protein
MRAVPIAVNRSVTSPMTSSCSAIGDGETAREACAPWTRPKPRTHCLLGAGRAGVTTSRSLCRPRRTLASSASLLITNEGGAIYWRSLDCIASCKCCQGRWQPPCRRRRRSPRPGPSSCRDTAVPTISHCRRDAHRSTRPTSKLVPVDEVCADTPSDYRHAGQRS